MNKIKRFLIVDVDGTVALRGDRDPYDMSRVGEDLPNTPVLELITLAHIGMWHMSRDPAHPYLYRVIFTSGRSETARYQTVMWLDHHFGASYELLMRAEGDDRPDEVVKKEMLESILPLGEVMCVIDDRNKVVQMWRENGLTCLQAAVLDR